MDELLKYGISQGPWAVIAIVSLSGAWRGAKWLGIDILKPVAVRHITFVDNASATLSDIRDDLRALREDHHGHVAKCPNSEEAFPFVRNYGKRHPANEGDIA